MSGFERLTVLEPKTSKEVRRKLQALSPPEGLELTISPETVESVSQLRTEPTVETFYRRYAQFNADEIVYDGRNDAGDHITLTVSTQRAASTPAYVTIVRRPRVSP